MKIKAIPYIFFVFFSLVNSNAFSQEKDFREIVIKIDTETKVKRHRPVSKKKVTPNKKFRLNAVSIDNDPDFYSVFTDFRIPAREGINESDLRYEGWKTDEARYAFRCKDGERVRLTFWQLDDDNNSEFINVTKEADECLESDLAYNLKAPKAISPEKKKTTKSKKTKVSKFKKDKEKKKIIRWEGPKK